MHSIFTQIFTLRFITLSAIRDWSLITGRGGYKMGGGGAAREVLPLRKGGGAEKVLAILKGGGGAKGLGEAFTQ